MDVRDAAQTIKETVSMDTILSLYGYQTKHGFMVCPFHGDKDASLKVYKGNKGWHCFGCGRGGSVIDFVMEHDGSSFRSAVAGIDEALQLDLLKDENPFDYYERKSVQRKADAFMNDMYKAISIQQHIVDLDLAERARKIAPIMSKPKQERTADEWTTLLALQEEMQYMDYLNTRFDELREGVRQWRVKRMAATKAG